MAVKIAIGHARVSKGDAEEIKNSLESQKSEIIKLKGAVKLLWNM